MKWTLHKRHFRQVLFVSGNITFDTNLTGSITSTGSFGNIQIGNFGGLPFASGSDLHQFFTES